MSLHISNILTEIRAAKKAALEAQESESKNFQASSNNLLGKKRKNENNAPLEKKDDIDEFLFNSNTTLNDLGGMDEIVNDIKETIGTPLSYYQLYKYMNIDPVKGILLCGPPGCGKTTIAQAIGGEYKIPFFKIAAPQIVSSLSGESESKIRKLFSAVESSAPSILFIDEIESILGKRENASKDMERRIVATITTCIDELGMKNDQKAPVFIIGATSKPEFIDSSVRRSGRFDKEIHIGFPNEIMREKMLLTLAKNKLIDEEIEFNKLAKLTPGYLAADLQSLLREAGRIAIKRILEENKHYCGENVSQQVRTKFNKFLSKLSMIKLNGDIDKNYNYLLESFDNNSIENSKINTDGIIEDLDLNKAETEKNKSTGVMTESENKAECEGVNLNSLFLKMSDFEEVY